MRGYRGWRDGNLATPRRVSSGVRRWTVQPRPRRAGL